VGEPGYEHAELGEQLVWFGIVLLIASAALVFLQRRAERLSAGPGASAARPSKNLVTIVAALAVVASLATGYQVYRVGDSGAKSAWGDAASVVNTR
jgi:uncharacterized iron-regulated membrane protein